VLSRQPNKSLGISIVGGKLDVCSSSNSSTTGNLADIGAGKSGKDQVSSFISGIFIKHVLENSPAGVNGTLKTGDRILAVNDVDLTQATHDRAVEVIRNAKSPVKFLIQSLICANSATLTAATIAGAAAAASSSPAPSNLINTNASNSSNASDLESSPMNYQGRLLQAETCKDEAANEENIIDPDKQIIDEPNKYNYTLENIKEKYNYLIELNASASQIGSGSPNDDVNKENSANTTTPKAPNSQLYIFKLMRTNPSESLGLSLSGNVNLNKTSVFVCGIYANSIAHRHGLIRVGDQILEINGHSLYGRAHSNVTPLIRNIKDLDVYIVVLR
jgi:C-terminal processing protease CtpA/Prc